MADFNDAQLLYAKFAWALDTHDDALLASLFTNDAHLSWRDSGGAGASADGRDAIVSVFQDARATQTEERRHVITNMRLVEQAGRASVYAYLTILGLPAAGPVIRASGLYFAEVEAGESGLQFSSLHTRFG